MNDIFINLTFAYLCFPCGIIFQRAPYGTCPRCQGKSVFPVQSFIPAWKLAKIDNEEIDD